MDSAASEPGAHAEEAMPELVAVPPQVEAPELHVIPLLPFGNTSFMLAATPDTAPEPRFVAAQAPSRQPIQDDDALVLVLDASSSMRAVDGEALKEALRRVLQFLATAGRRVSILVFHHDVLLIHPREKHTFQLLNCTLQEDGTTAETWCGQLTEMATVLHRPLDEANIEYILDAYMGAVGKQGSAAVRQTHLTTALRTAAAILRATVPRSAHGQVLVLCDGGESYGRIPTGPCAGRQAFLETPAVLERLVPVFASLASTSSVSVVALGPSAELDTLGAIADILHGVLAYAPTADVYDLVGAFADALRFLAWRPAAVLASQLSTQVQAIHTPSESVNKHVAAFAAALSDATALRRRIETLRILGSRDNSSSEVVAAIRPDGAAVLCDSAGAATLWNGERVDPSLRTRDTSSTDVGLTMQVAQELLALLWPCVSWRPSVRRAALDTLWVALLDKPSGGTVFYTGAGLMGTLSYVSQPLQRVMTSLSNLLHPASGVTSSEARQADEALAAAVRAGFCQVLRLVQAPAHMRVEVGEDLAEALDAMTTTSTSLAARADFCDGLAKWMAASEARAARYVCALLGDAQDVLGVPVTTSIADDMLLWRPSTATPGIALGPAIFFSETLGLWSADAHTAIVAGAADSSIDDRVPISRAARRAQAARDAARTRSTMMEHLRLLPLFLRLEEAMNPHASAVAARKLAGVLHDGDERDWQDALLPTRVYARIIGEWLDFASQDTPLLPPPLPLVADVLRALALTANETFVSDVLARFVHGKNGVPMPEVKPGTKPKPDIKPDTKPEPEEDAEPKVEGQDGTPEQVAYWRGPECVGSVFALGAVLALFRNPNEYVRARQAAISEYVDAETARRKAAAAAEIDTEVARRLEVSYRIRGAPRRERDRIADEHVVRKALLAERREAQKAAAGALADGTATSPDDTGVVAKEGAALDDAEAKAALTKEILDAMPVDVPFAKHLSASAYKLRGFVAEVVPALVAEQRRRDLVSVDASDAKSIEQCEARAARFKASLVRLHAVADTLIQTVPADEAALREVARVFGMSSNSSNTVTMEIRVIKMGENAARRLAHELV